MNSLTRATKPWERLRGRLKSKETTVFTVEQTLLLYSSYPVLVRVQVPGVVLLTEKLADSVYEIRFQLDLNKQVICKVSLRNTSNLKKFTRSSFWLLLDYTFIFQDVYNSGTPPYHPTTLILRTVVLDLRKSPFFSLFYIIITITRLGAPYETDIRIWLVQPEQTQMGVSFGWL